MTSEGFDPARAVAFAERVQGIVNGGALSLLLSIGHRAGLFDVMRRLGLATSGEIAGEAGLEEACVREWLGALAAGGIVEIEPVRRAFRLPAEHAACLGREAQRGNLALAAQWIPLLAQAEDEVLEGFAGAAPRASRALSREGVAEESDRASAAARLDAIALLAPDLRASLEAGIDVLDAGVEASRARDLLAEAFPSSRFERCDPDALDAKRSFDLVTAFGALHGQARPDAALAAIARALRPAGALLLRDVRGPGPLEGDAGHPLAPFLYAVSCLHGATAWPAARSADPSAGWSEETAHRRLAAAGFASVEVHTLPHDPIHRYTLARRRS